MFTLRPDRSNSNLSPPSTSNSTPLSASPLRPTRPAFPAGLQSPLQLSWDEARARGRSAQQAGSEGSSGGGKGFGGFFKRVRSSSRGRKKEEQQPKVQQRAPPVPAVPSDFRLSLGLGAMSAGSIGMGNGGGEAVQGDLGISMSGDEAFEAPAKPAPGVGGDLGDLLYLVHAAGDRFTSEPTSNDWSHPLPSPPLVAPTAQKTTPTLLQSSAFSSPGSPPSPATPKPYYSFFSHLGNNDLASYKPMTPPSSPPVVRTPPPKPESEDDYGGSSSDEEALWSRKPNTSFGRSPKGSFAPPPAPKQAKGSRLLILSPTRSRRRALGPKAKEVLDYTLLRLSPSSSTLSTAVPTRYQPSSLHHPLSTTPHRTIAAFGPTNTVQVVLGRTLIARKLLRGLTMLESMDLERGASRRRRDSQDSQSSTSTAGSFDEAAPRPTTPSLTLLIDTFEIDVDQPPPTTPVRPALSPLARAPKPPPSSPSSPSLQPARLRNWIARPSFAESHLNTLVIEGGIEMVDLVRPARGKVPKLAVSERLKAMAGLGDAGVLGEEKASSKGRPGRERPPTVGSNGGQQQRGGQRASSLPPPSAVGRKPVLPGPLLLRALAEKKLNGTGDSSEEEDLPLAVLRSRGSSTPASSSPASSSPAASSASTAALQKAQARAEKLEAEVGKLRKQEEARKASLTRMQREKEQREIEWQEEKREEERKRRVAEQRRRSRATGQVEDRPTGIRSASKDRQHKRASAAPPSKQHLSLAPSPSAYAAPFLPPAPPNLWAQPQMLAVPPPGWGFVPVPVMMPLPSPNTPPFYSPQPSPHASTSPFSTFAQAGVNRPPPPPPIPHSHSAPNRISQRSTSQGPSLKPPPNGPTSMRRSSSHGPPLNRSSRHAPPPLPSAMASGKRVSFVPPAVGMARSNSTPESIAVERERAKARDQLVGGGAGRKPVRW
ncbi:hypothetical protein BCR35DRAFT_310911 [Leucosporidium creatinivorum]|uniref:Uncharacterized protein n=1 Tax=Leucosporidium creatinivorum TaxID=106004 RepID=A0A1Y2CMI4_9BASI|nr:hypothetical protein BCR35DRAFT_310911 [Leucosporidium creatinivorum]